MNINLTNVDIGVSQAELFIYNLPWLLIIILIAIATYAIVCWTDDFLYIIIGAGLALIVSIIDSSTSIKVDETIEQYAVSDVLCTNATPIQTQYFDDCKISYIEDTVVLHYFIHDESDSLQLKDIHIPASNIEFIESDIEPSRYERYVLNFFINGKEKGTKEHYIVHIPTGYLNQLWD